MAVVSFESRRAPEMAGLIERHGGRAISAPSMREAPMDPASALSFAETLFAGGVDVMVLLTGVGTRLLVDAIATKYAREKVIAAIGGLTIVARGPKPVAALREMGLSPTITVPEPNTWEDLLEAVDGHGGVSGKRVVVQEYGAPNPKLVEGLERRGAKVRTVSIYTWALPEDLRPLRSAIDRVIAGEIHVALFTSATQAHHLMQVAKDGGKADALRQAMKRVCIGSIGPIASENIEQLGMHVDFEPDSPHMSHLVHELARRCVDFVEKKRVAADNGIDTNVWRRVDMRWTGSKRTIGDSVFMKACRREKVPYTPIWIMRQAGRYQREYHTLRKNMSFLELCRSSETAAEVTLMAVERLGVDAAIIFADILLVVETLGLHLAYVKGDGPTIDNPVRERGDLKRLREGDAGELSYVYEAVRLTRQALRPDIALIGFCGAPFTVASYIIDGGKSSNYSKTKAMMYRDPTTWHDLMGRLTRISAGYLRGQIEAGADAVQVFDSWAGSLSPDDYREFVLPYVTELVASVKSHSPGTPVINFATGNPALIGMLKEAGGDVVGLDWRVDLAEGWAQLGDDVAVMGNLDPTSLYGTPTTIRAAAGRILEKAGGRPGHIFNLGHGVSPDMAPELVAELVDVVHEISARPER